MASAGTERPQICTGQTLISATGSSTVPCSTSISLIGSLLSLPRLWQLKASYPDFVSLLPDELEYKEWEEFILILEGWLTDEF